MVAKISAVFVFFAAECMEGCVVFALNKHELWKSNKINQQLFKKVRQPRKNVINVNYTREYTVRF